MASIFAPPPTGRFLLSQSLDHPQVRGGYIGCSHPLFCRACDLCPIAAATDDQRTQNEHASHSNLLFISCLLVLIFGLFLMLLKLALPCSGHVFISCLLFFVRLFLARLKLALSCSRWVGSPKGSTSVWRVEPFRSAYSVTRGAPQRIGQPRSLGTGQVTRYHHRTKLTASVQPVMPGLERMVLIVGELA